MVRKFAILAALVVATSAFAGEGAPMGWYIAGSKAKDYLYGTEHVEGSIGKQSAYIQAKPGASSDGFGTLMQTIKADDYIGQRLRLSARIKCEDAVGFQMWFRVDGGDGKVMRFYNMQDRPVTGTTDWKMYDIVLDVPPGSVTLNYGFFLIGGKGKGWADATSLTPVDKTTPVSGMPVSRKPVNLSFDQ
jgi:hypothetical protein